MAINFPDSPSDGDLYTFDNKTWQYKNPPGAWNPVGTYVGITGPTGSTGATGATGATGTSGITTVVYEYALSDETTALTTGLKLTTRARQTLTFTGIRASLTTASSSGLVTVDILINGVSIFSTKITIDANEKTSTTAATAYVLSTASVTDDAELTFNVDGAGTNAAGLKVAILGTV